MSKKNTILETNIQIELDNAMPVALSSSISFTKNLIMFDSKIPFRLSNTFIFSPNSSLKSEYNPLDKESVIK